MRDSILIPEYNSTASLFKDNLANLKEKINLKQNPIESICHALAANNKFSEYEQQEKNNKFEPLLSIALKTTYFVAPDSAQIENARYKTIVEKSNKLKALLENAASEEEIQLYLDQNNDIAINIADAAGDMILHNLMGIGYEDKTVEKLKALIKYGGDINAQNAKGETPVHWAAYWVPVDYVEILTEHKNFNSTLKNLYGQTPIHYFVDAAEEEDASEHADTIIFLTKAGYKITKEKDINGWTAIDKAYLYHGPMIELQYELLETVRGRNNYLNETQYGYTNNEGDTRLHRLAELTPEEGRSAVFINDILNNRTNDINVKNSKGETPLHLAITNENIVNIIVLICSGANLFLKDNNDENSLDLLNKWPEGKLIDLFNTNAPVKSRIQEKINEFTEQNPNNDTYQGLDQALATPWDEYDYQEYEFEPEFNLRGHFNANNIKWHDVLSGPYYFEDNFEFMLEPAESSDVEDSGFEGSDSDDSGFEGNDSDDSGFEGSDSDDSGFEGSDSDDSGFEGRILGKRPNAPDNNAESANKRQKTSAANSEASLQDNDDSMNHADIVQPDGMLAVGGAMNNHHMLHVAVAKGDINTARALIIAGADVNAASSSGMIPLHIATSQGNAEMVTVLIERGADVNKVYKNGMTPLHIAAGKGYTDIARTLIMNSADREATYKNELTPLLLALGANKEEMVDMLIDLGVNLPEQYLEAIQALNQNNFGDLKNLSSKDIQDSKENDVIPLTPNAIENLTISQPHKDDSQVDLIAEDAIAIKEVELSGVNL